MHIERLTSKDIEAAHDLILEGSGVDIDHASFVCYVLTNDGEAFVAREDEDNKIIGVILGTCGVESGISTIDCLFVEPEHRFQGLATMLLNAFLDHCNGCKTCSLEVMASNSTAHQLYLDIGFKDVGKVQKQWVQGDLIKMERSVTVSPV